MAEITKPIALDESFNTTEGSPRNVADVLAQGIGDLVTVVSRISHQTTYDELSDLEDVNISSPTNGDVLTYDGSKWTNGQGGGGSSAEQMIAPVETSTTASQAYAIGEQFILNGVLYTATAAITAGGTITIGGNCTASDTVTEQIKEKSALKYAEYTLTSNVTIGSTGYASLCTLTNLGLVGRIDDIINITIYNVYWTGANGFFISSRPANNGNIYVYGTPNINIQSGTIVRAWYRD